MSAADTVAMLPFAHGGPPITGRLRVEPGDFRVDEELGFEPAGAGEHAFLFVEKIDANTEWVSKRLAEKAGVAPMSVGYAGLKDRHAITRQSFSVHLPGKADPDWSALAIPGVRVLAASRHDRKLKRGAHRGNRFRIRARDVEGDRGAIEQRLALIRERGVPNYFGEQRFGRDAANVTQAREYFAGKRMRKNEIGFAISAARSLLFNAVLARRVADGSWDSALDGEVWMLAGTHSIFGPEPWTVDLARRLAAFDIDPTGPLIGAGELRTTGAVRALEEAAIAPHRDLAEGLARAGLVQQRRALRLRVEGLAHEWEGDDALVLEFRLPAGSFATVVLRELSGEARPDPSGR
ncbi:MAG TPA: tRNA pseudouridine(13) synthase TruD [Rhodanobacteraceae bacterium]|nr:tRNA pseudouridine(13) synthase TruD [Rhodanobacteraceae bacterium]